jgi:hypothetical protein
LSCSFTPTQGSTQRTWLVVSSLSSWGRWVISALLATLLSFITRVLAEAETAGETEV